MSNYTKLTDFAAKDTLPSGNAAKLIRGSEFDYEFNLDYDNKIELNDLTFNDHYNLAEAVMKGIDNHFKIEKDA